MVIRDIKSDLYLRWTKDAINCYRLGGNCSMCDMERICKNQAKTNEYRIAPMKYSVLKLYARHGKPRGGYGEDRAT